MANVLINQTKEAIRKNYLKLKENLANPDDVAEYLHSDCTPPILTGGMLEEVKAANTKSKKTSILMDLLAKRGERVPQCLYQALMETENQELAEGFIEYINMQNKERSKSIPSEWPPLAQELSEMLNTKVHRLKPKDATVIGHFNKEDTYKMSSKRRGVVLIINIVTYDNKVDPMLPYRTGSDQDAKNLEDLFKELHFEVKLKNNLSSEEILNFAESEARAVTDSDNCIVVAIFTHGDSNGIYGSDNQLVSVDRIKEKFYPTACPALNEKPKIFLIQACRGKQIQKSGAGAMSRETKNVEDQVDAITSVLQNEFSLPDSKSENENKIVGTETVHSDSDFFIAYSTPEGAVSYRHKEVGSWFILAIVWVFRYHAHQDSLQNLMQKVKHIVSIARTGKQGVTVSEDRSTLRRSLYFFPGIYECHGYPREHPGSLV